MNISICSLLGQCCSANRQDIEKKKRFLPLQRESKMKRLSSKVWHLKFSFLSFVKFAIFAKCLENHVLLFLLMSGLCVINGTQ